MAQNLELGVSTENVSITGTSAEDQSHIPATQILPAHKAHDAALDPFDTLLDLETVYETEGYTDGLRDGRAQARLSARLFGIEKAGERWETLGRLRCRTLNWAEQYGVDVAVANGAGIAFEGGITAASARTQPVAGASKGPSGIDSGRKDDRLRKHLGTLMRLTDPSTLSMRNDDDAIGDFDERMKRAVAKLKVVERILGVSVPTAGQESGRKHREAAGDGLDDDDDDDDAEGKSMAQNNIGMDDDIENPRLNIAALNMREMDDNQNG